ncbi:TonB-dependent receptor [Microvirga sp. SRT01]|uniref:TonB-dependent receptor n=1 Tax=Sphingomonas longa TaxID=2778730 RepID=A0ABS2DA77_9SPHN|nr:MULTISPECIES: TonB-dependent receptor [Alphaproteobacteria]MBM6577832.1 TonB-dependent receptor [Sphingomonas sp. BT552]MBR7710874.1 TonB-dependent receptor [Microvirga sp. SRT01]
MKTLQISLCAGVSALALAAAPAWAQAGSKEPAQAVPPPAQQVGEAQADPAATTDRAQRGGLEDIVVTARKRVENVQNIPVAETVVSSEQLQNQQITSIERLSSVAPQLIVGRSGTGNGAAIGLRGISVNATSISLEQSVAVVIDGVYYSGGRALNEGLFDLERAEVIKGPQSLFYGKNTTAGALSFTTADPTREFHGMARVGYEFRADQVYSEGFVSGPLSSTLSARLAGRVSKQYDGIIDNLATGGTLFTTDIVTGTRTAHPFAAPSSDDIPAEKQKIFRAGLKWTPDSALSATVKATYNKVDQSTPHANVVIGFCEQGFVQSDRNAPCGRDWRSVQQRLPADIAASNPLLNRRNGLTYLEYESVGVSGNLQYDGDKVNISIVPGYIDWRTRWRGDNDFVQAYIPPSNSGNGSAEDSSLKAFSVEARAQSRFKGPLNVLIGGYYQDSDLDFQQDNLFPGGAENSAVSDQTLRYLTLRKVSHTYGKTYAGFGQILLDVSPTLNLTAGARYTHETKSSVFAQPYVIRTAQATYRQDAIGADQSFDNFSPEGTVTWKPSSDVTVYGSYKTGYKSGGFSISGLIVRNTTPADATFAPEKVKGFEGGIKTTLADRQLRVNLNAFNYNYSDLQVDFFDATIVQYLTLNAGKARTRGVELEAEYAPRPVPGLTLRGSLAYTDAKYTSFPFSPCLSGQRPDEGCTVGQTPNGVRSFQNLTGERTQQAPVWTGTSNVDYSRPIGGGLKVGFTGSMRYSGSYHTSPFANSEARRFIQGSYATFDLNVRLAEENDRWELALIGKNLTNRFITAAAFDLTYTGSGTATPAGIHADGRSSVYDPRTIAVQGTVRF